jgi:phospholipase/carboxylesterase
MTALMHRRSFLQAMGVTAALAACGRKRTEAIAPGDRNARLAARPSGSTLLLPSGESRVVVEGTGVIAYLPESAVALESIPLFVFLHGAGRTIDPYLQAFKPLCDHAKVMWLAPYSDYGTWDAIHGEFGPDRIGIDRALQWVFNRVPVNPAKIIMSGFSDGATYALAMGRANGDLFNKIVAFAPGDLLEVTPVGLPPIAIAHGNEDPILSFNYAWDSIAPRLRAAGHAVEFHSFSGGHAVSLVAATAQINLLGGVH